MSFLVVAALLVGWKAGRIWQQHHTPPPARLLVQPSNVRLLYPLTSDGQRPARSG